MWFTEAIVEAEGLIGIRRPKWNALESILVKLDEIESIFQIPESRRYPAIKNIDYLADDWELDLKNRCFKCLRPWHPDECVNVLRPSEKLLQLLRKNNE